MTPDKQTLDRIVREVMRRLDAPPRAPRPSQGTANGARSNGASSSAATPVIGGELRVAERVVTLASLEGRLQGIRRVRIDARAIVTPAVRDRLTELAIDVERSDPTASTDASALRLVVATAETDFNPKGLLAALRDSTTVERLESACLSGTVDRVAARLGDSRTLGLLLCGPAAAAVCLANRHTAVRAVLADSVREVEQGVAEAGANLLVVRPDVCNLTQLRRIVETFCRPGPRNPPDSW